MDRSFTPGPWKATDRPKDACCWTHHVETEAIDAIFGSPRLHVADVDGEANARLISAAPDLLVCAQTILAYFEPPHDEARAAMEALEAAIAKAEGREVRS